MEGDKKPGHGQESLFVPAVSQLWLQATLAMKVILICVLGAVLI